MVEAGKICSGLREGGRLVGQAESQQELCPRPVLKIIGWFCCCGVVLVVVVVVVVIVVVDNVSSFL